MSVTHAVGRRLPRTWLFVPGDDPVRIRKALGSSAEAVIIDLEDAIPVDRRRDARAQLKTTLLGLTRPNLFVRVNGPSTQWFADDIEALDGLPVAGIVLPMLDSAEGVLDAARRLERVATGQWIVPLIETAAGIVDVQAIAKASPRVLCLVFGGGDYSLDLGMPAPGMDPLPFLMPRVAVLLAARTAGLLGAIDTPNGKIHDLAEVTAEAAAAAALGFKGKLAIHPSQLDVIARAFEPSAASLSRAREIVEAFESSVRSGKAAIMVGDVFVDYAIAHRARTLLNSAAATCDVGRGPSTA